MRELDEDQRAVFVLAELEGYTGREIARALSINPNTASSRLRLARRAFCAHFGVERSRRATQDATRQLREQPLAPAEDSRSRSWGLILATLAQPGRTLAASSGLLAFVSGKVGASLGLAGAALIGVLAIGVAPSDESPATRIISSAADAPSTTGPSALPPASEPASLPTPAPDPLPSPSLASAAPGQLPLERPSSSPALVEARGHAPSETTGAASPAEALRSARGALIAGDPRRALSLLDTFPDSDPRVRGPRVATQVAALCKLGEAEAARARVEALQAREADSPLLGRLDGACW